MFYDLQNDSANLFSNSKTPYLYYRVAEKLYDVDKSIYHLSDIKKKKNSITFNDNMNDYSFNLSKSALNQWNAGGRERDINEVYIPIPIVVHQKKPSFFPDRDKTFNLKLPNGKILQSKVCQSGSKALMSYSNKALGKWVLREVLSLEEGELLTYEKLQITGVDSVRIDKIDLDNYEINFASLHSFENFYTN